MKDIIRLGDLIDQLIEAEDRAGSNALVFTSDVQTGERVLVAQVAVADPPTELSDDADPHSSYAPAKLGEMVVEISGVRWDERNQP